MFNHDNGSEIPSFLHPKTDKSLSNITFTEKDIEKVIQSLDPNKAHGHDMISIHPCEGLFSQRM